MGTFQQINRTIYERRIMSWQRKNGEKWVLQNQQKDENFLQGSEKEKENENTDNFVS